MPNGNEQIYARIDKILSDKQISRRKLAQKIGMPPSTLQSAFEKGSNLSFERLTQIADALEIDVNWLLNGFTLEEHDEAFFRRVRHEPPLSERELYLLKHPNDEPALAPARPDVAQMIEGLTEENVKQLMNYADFLKSRQAPQDAPAGPDDKEPVEK